MTQKSLSPLLLLILVLVQCRPVEAQSPEVTDQVSQAEIDKLKARIETDVDLDKETADKALANLKQASDALAIIEGLKAKEAAALAQLNNVEKELTKLKQDLEAAQSLTDQAPDVEKSLFELEQELAEKQRKVAETQTLLTKAESSIEERNTQIKSIKERLAQIPAEVVKVDAEISTLETSTDPPLLVDSKRMALLATRRQLQQEPSAIQSDLSAIEARAAAKILQTERQIYSLNLAVQKQELDNWTTVVTNKRRAIAEDRREKSIEFSKQTEDKALKQLFLDNAEIVNKELGISAKRQAIESEITSIVNKREKWNDEWSQVRKREERIGSSKSFGIRLRQQRRDLVKDLRDSVSSHEQAYEEAQEAYLGFREERRKLDNINDLITQAINSLNTQSLDDAEIELQTSLVRTAYEQKRNYLDELIDAYEGYIESLEELDYEQESLVELSQAYAKYIDERVLWIRSHEALTPSLILNDASSLEKLVDTSSWKTVAMFFGTDAKRHPIIYILAVVIWTVLLATQPFQKAAIKASGKQASSRLNISLTPTNRALLWTFVKSTIFPLPFLFLSWRAETGQAPVEVMVLTRHLRLVSLGIFGFEFIRNVCRKDGLGSLHFGWSERVNKLTSMQIGSFITLASPIALMIAILRSRSADGDVDSIERICFVAIYLLSAYMLHRLTSHKSGITSEWVINHPASWFSQFAGLVYLVSVSIPLILAVLTIAGYSYASTQIAQRLGETMSLIFLVIFLRAYLFRWLTLGQRRRAIRQAREMRNQMDKQETQTSLTADAQSSSQPNLAESGQQTRRLLTSIMILFVIVALWFLWQDILPALNKLDVWKLPGTSIAITSLGFAVLVGLLILSAARNVPGLLEVLLLERLPFDRSARYAIKAVTQYVIVLFGMIMISQIIGVGWGEVQWLAAALTFGLGFGLQEIFANFVSGLIILFEQPVRVGDVVTIDDVSGVISRIRIRSTTITDWDRKEYIVPNKEFITGRLLNWTLTDTINRVTIDVGVAYGSDADQVKTVLESVVSECDDLLKDPPHIITFSGFGDSSLNFTVRVYLPVIEKRLIVIDELHTSIYKALAKAGIEIPFPQRDLHVRSITALSNPAEILEELQRSQQDESLE